MEEGLAEFRSGMHVVWLYYSAEASDPEGDEVRYIWSQVSPEEPVAIIDQDDEFVPSGQAEKMKLCVPPSGAQITLQVVAMDKSGAKSEPKSVVVNDAGCASKERWAQLSKFAELRESANQGDPRSHEALAYAYINGTGVLKNEETGVDLMRTYGCLRCLLLVMCTYPFAKKALTLHLACGEGRARHFGCNLMQRKVLASSHQHLMAEAPCIRQGSGLRSHRSAQSWTKDARGDSAATKRDAQSEFEHRHAGARSPYSCNRKTRPT